jgi:ATP-dependent 26S proteasome regulatory subunit
VTLSGLLNFTDGLWSFCGEERIIVFTTNHVEGIDPSLLRPGRMCWVGDRVPDVSPDSVLIACITNPWVVGPFKRNM